MSIDHLREMFADFEVPSFFWPKTSLVVDRSPEKIVLSVHVRGTDIPYTNNYTLTVTPELSWFGDEPTPESIASGPSCHWLSQSDSALRETLGALYHTDKIVIRKSNQDSILSSSES